MSSDRRKQAEKIAPLLAFIDRGLSEASIRETVTEQQEHIRRLSATEWKRTAAFKQVWTPERAYAMALRLGEVAGKYFSDPKPRREFFSEYIAELEGGPGRLAVEGPLPRSGQA